VRQKYERAFGDQYHCAANNAGRLAELFGNLCSRYGIATRMEPYTPESGTQLSLF